MIKGLENGIGISQAFPTKSGKEAKPAAAADGAGKFLGELVGKVNEMQLQADKAVQSLASGESKGLHEVMIAMEKSSVSFQFLSQVRNKALEAYNDVLRMQV